MGVAFFLDAEVTAVFAIMGFLYGLMVLWMDDRRD